MLLIAMSDLQTEVMISIVCLCTIYQLVSIYQYLRFRFVKLLLVQLLG